MIVIYYLGEVEFDTVLMEVDRKKAADCPRRPMRIIRKSDIEVGNDAGDDDNETKKKEDSKIDHSKDPVCDLITHRRFYAVVKMINPAYSDDEVELIYLYASRLGQAHCLRSLERYILIIKIIIIIKIHVLIIILIRLWVHYPVSALNDDIVTSSLNTFASRMNSIPTFTVKDEKKKKYLHDYFYVNTDSMSTQWTAPYKTVSL